MWQAQAPEALPSEEMGLTTERSPAGLLGVFRLRSGDIAKWPNPGLSDKVLASVKELTLGECLGGVRVRGLISLQPPKNANEAVLQEFEQEHRVILMEEALDGRPSRLRKVLRDESETSHPIFQAWIRRVLLVAVKNHIRSLIDFQFMSTPEEQWAEPAQEHFQIIDPDALSQVLPHELRLGTTHLNGILDTWVNFNRPHEIRELEKWAAEQSQQVPELPWAICSALKNLAASQSRSYDCRED